MASSDLQTFLQDRLVALDPSIDISAGSPAQTKFISPVLTYLGTDPFETSIDSFILDRFQQEFPDLYAADPGALRDLFIKPLQLILEPFKREIATVRRNQSLRDPSLLSDDDADALVANVFDSRDRGGFAAGVVRAFFATPTNVGVDIANRVFSKGSLSFFPTTPTSISAELMSFNRDGGLFFMDITVRAESPGAEYNVEAGDIVGIDGLANLVKATNPRKFTGGSARQDNESFVSAAEISLTERSLANRRGTVARLNSVFKGQLRGVQVIGAKDPEMQRDILVARSNGHSWITGPVTLYKNVALVRARTIEGSVSVLPVQGDTLLFYLYDSAGSLFTAVSQEDRLVRLQVEDVLVAQQMSGAYQYAYFVRWSDPNQTLDRVLGAGYQAFLDSLPFDFEGGFARKDTCKISSLPGAIETSLEVSSGDVHVFGHADIYVRPTIQDVSQVTVDGLYDLGKLGNTTSKPHFFLERANLSTASSSAVVTDAGFSFVEGGVLPGDILVVETGADAGNYVIGSVSGSTITVDHVFGATSSNLRYRIVRNIRVNPFEFRVPKFPFGDATQLDLSTNIGSYVLQTSANNMLSYGVVAGDVVRILEGPDAGDYVIQSFDPVLGGFGMVVGSKMTSTGSNFKFEVFTKLSSVQRPLVRIRELLLLDSSKQSTGLTIPPADPVAVVPSGPMTSAKVLGASAFDSGYVLPDLADLLTDGGPGLQNHAASGGGSDRRYSLGFDTPDGNYVAFQFHDNSGPTTQSEFDVRSDAYGKTSYFLATTEVENDAINFPPIDPKPGECLSLKTGPNKGDYLIKNVYKFKYGTHRGTVAITKYCYFIQIYGTFPTDPFRELIKFMEASGVGTGLDLTGLFPLSFPDFFINWYDDLGNKVISSLAASGVNLAGSYATIQAMIDAMCKCSYEHGMPARGVLRTFFREPTLFEQSTGTADQVTTYSFEAPSGELVKFRPDPVLYLENELIPARTSVSADVATYPTDLEVAVTLPLVTSTGIAEGNIVYGATNGGWGYVSSVPNGTSVILRSVVGTFGNGESIQCWTGGPDWTQNLAVTTTVNGALASYGLLTSSSTPTFFTAGIAPGDVVSVHEELYLYGTNDRIAVVVTESGSPIVRFPSNDALFTPSMAGGVLRILEGDDEGVYRITQVGADGKSLTLDRVLTRSTGAVLKSGYSGTVTVPAGTATFVSGGGDSFTTADVEAYITFYGINYNVVGSYRITGYTNPTTILFANGDDSLFSANPTGFTAIQWAVTAAPDTAPVSIDRGGIAPHLSGASKHTGYTSIAGVPVRIFTTTQKSLPITTVTESSSESSVLVTIESSLVAGIGQPYRVFRPNVRRVTPTEMNDNKAGFLSYFDTNVVSLSPSSAANIGTDSYLLADEGTYFSAGYRHVVIDPTLSYSDQESGFLDLPTSVLPVFSADSRDNMVSLLGTPIQISYERADLVSLVQDFASSATDRLVAANLLVRHFLPAYLSYDATYVGGSSTSVIAKDIFTYLDQIRTETAVDVSEIEKVISGRGGNPITPTTLTATIYDWDRKMWVEFGQNTLGGQSSTDTKVPYNGTPRVTFFLPGPDVSGQDPLPTGERINLTRQ